MSALKKCPELTIVPSRFDLYLGILRKLIKLLEEYTPDIEKFSIDEAFLDMTETIHLLALLQRLPIAYGNGYTGSLALLSM